MLRTIEYWYLAFLAANLVMGTSSILIPLKLDRVLGLGPSQLGILSTCASTAAVFGSLVWGRLSDAVHRRKMFVVASYFVVGFAHVGLAFARSFSVLVLVNSVLSFFWIANASVAVLLVIERTRQETWELRISTLNLSGAVGWLLGLIAGGTGVSAALIAMGSEAVGIRVAFLALGICGLVAGLLALLMVPSTRAQFTDRRFRGLRIAIGNLLTEGWKFSPMHLYHRLAPRRLLELRHEVRVFFVATFLAFTGIGFFAVPLPLLLSQRLGYSPSLVFYGYVMLHSGIVLSYPLALRRVRRNGNRLVQVGALSVRVALFAVAAGVLLVCPSVPWSVTASFMFLVGVSWSFFQLSGVALASRLAKPENRGLALGTYNAIAGASTIVAGVSSGYLASNVGHHMTFAVAAALILAAVTVLLRLANPVRQDAAADGNDPAVD